jgi:acetyl-CoA carboxylase carboxyl transferase subunit alpha
VDEIIAEPEGGIHADPEKGAELLGASIRKHLALLKEMTPEAMLAERQKKFRNIAQFYTESRTPATEPA